jgi:hypothetical protein
MFSTLEAGFHNRDHRIFHPNLPSTHLILLSNG